MARKSEHVGDSLLQRGNWRDRIASCRSRIEYSDGEEIRAARRHAAAVMAVAYKKVLDDFHGSTRVATSDRTKRGREKEEIARG